MQHIIVPVVIDSRIQRADSSFGDVELVLEFDNNCAVVVATWFSDESVGPQVCPLGHSLEWVREAIRLERLRSWGLERFSHQAPDPYYRAVSRPVRECTDDDLEF